MAKDDYDRQTKREKFKDNYLETRAGSRLKALGIHPVIPSMISVQTEDGFRTTVDRASLVENEALLKLYAGEQLTVSSAPTLPEPTSQPGNA